MIAWVAAASLSLSAAQPKPLPEEVQSFLRDRQACEHFMGEPVDEAPRTKEERERRAFVVDAVDIYCAGTDRRLAALKRRYAADSNVMELLRPLDQRIE